jgi:hypothetical protein
LHGLRREYNLSCPSHGQRNRSAWRSGAHHQPNRDDYVSGLLPNSGQAIDNLWACVDLQAELLRSSPAGDCKEKMEKMEKWDCASTHESAEQQCNLLRGRNRYAAGLRPHRFKYINGQVTGDNNNS